MGCATSASVVRDSGLDQDIDNVLGSMSPTHFHQRYRMGEILGTGAFAQVYAAWSDQEGSEGKEVAIKVTSLRGPMLRRREMDKRAVDRTEHETKLLRRIAGLPCCILIFEHTIMHGVSYIVTERCECSLVHALESAEGLTEARFAHLVRQMLQALAGIHQRSVVHRDVKAANFLWTGTTLKLCDFGCSESLQSGKELFGKHGTLPYMSPEMLSGFGYGMGTDVWSLGVLVYVLLFGEFPNCPRQKTREAMEAAILVGKPGPSYHPASPGTQRPSGCAEKFLRLALVRGQDLRTSAKELLGHAWVTQPAFGQERSIRAAVMSARRNGAFPPRDQMLSAPQEALNMHVRQMQGIRGGPGASSTTEKAPRGTRGHSGDGAQMSWKEGVPCAVPEPRRQITPGACSTTASSQLSLETFGGSLISSTCSGGL